MNESFELERVSIRMVKDPPLYSEEPVDSPNAAVKLMAEVLQDYDREVVAVVNLRTNLQPINMNIVSIGALDQAVANPREIMKSAILSNAASIMLVHNHPSGNLRPSREDCNLTDRINKVCDLFGIQLIDHVIVGNDGNSYYSFRENNQLRIAPRQMASRPEEIQWRERQVAEKGSSWRNREKEKEVTLEEEDDLEM